MAQRVIIIEDDDILRDIYTLKFKMEGFDVSSAPDGAEGLKMVAQLQPDLIILDMLMPKLGGIEFLKRYSQAYPDSLAKIIVASNKSSTETIAAAKRLGAVDYLIKSQLTPDEIVVNARHHLDGPHAAR